MTLYNNNHIELLSIGIDHSWLPQVKKLNLLSSIPMYMCVFLIARFYTLFKWGGGTH